MFKPKPIILILLVLIVAAIPVMADSVWIGRDTGATQCRCTEGRSLDADRAELEKLGVAIQDGCRGLFTDVVTCGACCVCSGNVVNFFFIDEEDLPIAQKAGWAPAADRMSCP